MADLELIAARSRIHRLDLPCGRVLASATREGLALLVDSHTPTCPRCRAHRAAA